MVEIIKQLTGNELKVWLYVYKLRNEHNITFKTASQLMDELELSHKTIYNSLKTLKDAELIEVNGSKKMIKILKEPL